jgi:hypothetical protein
MLAVEEEEVMELLQVEEDLALGVQAQTGMELQAVLALSILVLVVVEVVALVLHGQMVVKAVAVL